MFVSRDDFIVDEHGTVDPFIGPSAPDGFEANLLQTNPEEGAFLVFRFYGPTGALSSGAWKLNDPVLVE